MDTKICFGCGVEKSVSEFHKNFHSKDGFQFYCKTCKKEIDTLYLKTDKGRASRS